MNFTIWFLKHLLEFISTVITHEGKLEVSPTGQNGEIFTNTIDLLRQNDHYHLVKSRNKNIHQSQSNSIEKGKQIYFHNIFHN